MFGSIGGSLGAAVFFGVEKKYGDVNYVKGHDYKIPQRISATGVATSGIVIDVIIGVATVVIGALVVAYVIPLPMAVGTALITGGGLYMLLAFGCGSNGVPIAIGWITGICVGHELRIRSERG